jgi:hypothetical protein
MTCHNCGKACATRSDGRRVLLCDMAVFFCNACPWTDSPSPLGDRFDRACEVILAEDEGGRAIGGLCKGVMETGQTAGSPPRS